MKKKVVSVLLVAAMAVGCLAGCGSKEADVTTTDDTTAATTDDAAAEDTAEDTSADATYSIAMITDSGDITDQSFNQSTYEACKEFAEENSLEFQYYKPTDDSDEARIASFNNAVADGYNVVVVPGYLFANMIAAVAEDNPEITIIALDVGESDLSDAGVETVPSNVVCFTYQEELAGYMAGYAAVKEGYTHLGFLGGMAVPAVIRYGFGYVQGANDAAVEMGIADQVTVEYVYGGIFYGDPSITAVMDTWIADGTEVIFGCGGGVYTSAGEAIQSAGKGKLIGVDVDQSYTIDGLYGEGTCITSAMKGLAATVKSTLADLLAGNWANYGGTVTNLGIVSGDDPTANYVQLPMDTWTMQNFTVDDYKALVASLADGTITVSNDTENMPETEITVNTYDNIN